MFVEISRRLNVSYEFIESVDNRYGVKTPHGTWNGETKFLKILKL